MSEAETLRAILEKEPTDIQAFIGLCRIAQKDGDYGYLAELHRYRAQVIKDSNEIADLYFKAGEVFLDKMNDLTRGVESLLAGFESDKTHAGIGDRLNVIYREAQDWEAVIQILDQRIYVLEKVDKSGTMVVVRSDLHQQLGEIWERVYENTENAMKNYRKAVELDRTNLPALYSARKVYYEAGKYKNAAKLCELEARAEKDTERRVALYRELGHLLNDHLSDPDQAVVAIKRALKLAPESEEIKLDLAKMAALTPFTEDNQKNHKWACEYLLRAAKKADPYSAMELATLALLNEPESEEAHTFLKAKALELDAGEKLEETYKALIDKGESLEAKAPHIRRLATFYIEEIGNPEKALEWMQKLEPLGLSIDKTSIEHLSKGVTTRASQIPPASPVLTQPEVVKEFKNVVADREDLEPFASEGTMEEDESTPEPQRISKPEPESTFEPEPKAEIEPMPAPRFEPAPAVTREAPIDIPNNMSAGDYIALLHKDADKARRLGDDATAEERFLEILDHDPQDQKATTYLERRFRARSDWAPLRDLLLRSAGANHLPPAAQTVRLREAARISEEQLGDINGAITAWKLIRESDTKVRDAGDALARLLTQAERWEELLEIMSLEAETTKNRTKRIEAYRRIADINRVRLGNAKAAIEAFKKVLELSPDDENALEALDQIYLIEQNYEELVPLLKRRAELSRDRETKRNLLTRTVLTLRESLNRKEEAYNLAKDILAIAPSDNEVLEIMEALDEEEERWGQLLNTLDLRVRAAETSEDKARFLRKKSAISIDKFQDIDTAAKALREVLEIVPGDIEAMNHLVEIYNGSGEWEDLVEIHRMRLNIETDTHLRAEMLKEIARILESNLKRPDEALEVWRQAIELEEDMESLAALLKHCERTENWSELAEIIKRQTRYAEDYGERADILFRRAEIVLDKLGEKDTAIAELTQIIQEVDATHAPALELLRQIYVEDGNFEEASVLLDQQIEHAENETKKKELLVLLGTWCKEELSDLERATDALEQAQKIDTSDAKVMDILDEIYFSAKNWNKLLKLLEQRFRIEPEDEKKLDIAIRGARLSEEKLKDSKQAWAWYRLAFSSLRHIEGTFEIVDEAARRMELWKPLIEDVYGIIIHTSTDVDEQVDWWLKISTIFEEKLDDVPQALEAVVRGFGLAPESKELLKRVDHLAVRSKAWKRLSTVYGVLVSRASGEEKIGLLTRYAKLLADQEDQASPAFDVSLKAFELDPKNDELLAIVEEIGKKAERFKDLVRVYTACRRFADTTDKKMELSLRTTHVLRDKIKDSGSALQQILGILRLDPFSKTIREKVGEEISILEENNGSDLKGACWIKLIEAYRVLEHENRNNRLRQAELVTEIASIFADKLANVKSAFDSLKEIQQLNPRDEDAIDRLESLARQHNYWDAVTDHYRDILDESFEMEIAVLFHRRRARILEEELNLPDEAAEHYWQIIQLDVSDVNGYEKLLAYYEKTEKWNELTNLLERQLNNTKDQDAKQKIQLKIASIWESRIKNKYEAKDWYTQIVTIWPDNEEAKAALARLKTDESIDDEDDDSDDISSLISIPPPPPDDDDNKPLDEERTQDDDLLFEEKPINKETTPEVDLDVDLNSDNIKVEDR